MLVGCLGSIVGESVDFGEGVSTRSLEAAAHRIIGDDGVGIAKSSDVVSLGGGKEGDGVVTELLWEVEG